MDIKKKLSDKGAAVIGGAKQLGSTIKQEWWEGLNGHRNDPSDREPPKPDIRKEWSSLRSVLLVAEKLLTEDTTIQESRFTNAARQVYSSGRLEQALTRLVEISEAAAKTEAAYRNAGIILQGYYAQDKIYDFTADLLESWGQELIDEDPDLYARELYHNNLVNIRRLFQRMQDKIQHTENDCGGQPSKLLLERRLTALERYHYSDPDLNAFAKAVRETRKLYNQVNASLGGKQAPEFSADYQKFAEAARGLSSLFLDSNRKITEEKLDAFTHAISEIIQEETQRITRMEEEIDRANRLYSRLCDVLAKEDAVLFLDSLNPKTGHLEGKSAEDIYRLYRPLMEQLREITEEFKK